MPAIDPTLLVLPVAGLPVAGLLALPRESFAARPDEAAVPATGRA